MIRDACGAGTDTVCRTVHRVAEALHTLKDEFIRWPEDTSNLAKAFFDLGGFPSCAGAIDGTHVNVSPLIADGREDYRNRHADTSVNVVAVAGADLSFFFVDANAPGKYHDSRALRESSLWTTFEVDQERPFPEAVLIGDLGYPLREWLITPFVGNN